MSIATAGGGAGAAAEATAGDATAPWPGVVRDGASLCAGAAWRRDARRTAASRVRARAFAGIARGGGRTAARAVGHATLGSPAPATRGRASTAWERATRTPAGRPLGRCWPERTSTALTARGDAAAWGDPSGSGGAGGATLAATGALATASERSTRGVG